MCTNRYGGIYVFNLMLPTNRAINKSDTVPTEELLQLGQIDSGAHDYELHVPLFQSVGLQDT